MIPLKWKAPILQQIPGIKHQFAIFRLTEMIPLCYCHSLQQTPSEPALYTKFEVTTANFQLNAPSDKESLLHRQVNALLHLLLPLFLSCFSLPVPALAFLNSCLLNPELFSDFWAEFIQSCTWLSTRLSAYITFVTSVIQWQLLFLSSLLPCYSELTPATLLSSLYMLKNDLCLFHLRKQGNNHRQVF